MISAFDIFLKYVINLLKPNRPLVWRSIKTDNTMFRARIACMKGHEDILRQIGYTEMRGNSLQFPEDVLEPDKRKLYIIAAELLMAKLEVEQLNDQAISVSGGSQVGYQSQHQGYRGQDFNIQQCSDTSTPSPVDYHGYGKYLCVHVWVWVCGYMCSDEEIFYMILLFTISKSMHGIYIQYIWN